MVGELDYKNIEGKGSGRFRWIAISGSVLRNIFKKAFEMPKKYHEHIKPSV